MQYLQFQRLTEGQITRLQSYTRGTTQRRLGEDYIDKRTPYFFKHIRGPRAEEGSRTISTSFSSVKLERWLIAAYSRADETSRWLANDRTRRLTNDPICSNTCPSPERSFTDSLCRFEDSRKGNWVWGSRPVCSACPSVSYTKWVSRLASIVWSKIGCFSSSLVCHKLTV